MTRCHALVLFTASTFSPTAAFAFPPYRSTDADTAEPSSLEFRLGGLEAERKEHETTLTAPLVHLNLGLPYHLELTTETEFDPSERAIGDAAAGAKWIPVPGRLAFGTEVLALLPVSSAGGAGVEAQALSSYQATPLVLHLNAGGFIDERPEPSERGFRAGLLTEFDLGPARPGLELFLRQVADEQPEVLAGLGSIIELGFFDLRLGMHAGLTDEAPDLIGSVWLCTTMDL